MRRKLAYILLNGALILASAGLIGNQIVKMDKDISYADGKDLVFRISEKGTTTNGAEPKDYIVDDGHVAVDAVAGEMEARLNAWGVNATVQKEGYDTVRVSIRAEGNDATEYQYLKEYLPFSGGNFSVGPSVLKSIEDGEDVWGDEDKYNNNHMFEGQTARIDYVNGVPVVVIPVNEGGSTGAFNTLVDWCKNNSKEADSEGNGGSTCYLLLWNNKQEGDNYDTATSGSNANMRKRLIFGEAGANAWFKEADPDKDYTEFQLIPNSVAIQDSGYDASKAGAAYKAAFFYMSMLNASDYGDINSVGYDVNFAFEHEIPASTETLISAQMSEYPALTATLVATAVALVVLIGISVWFYRLGSLAIVANVSVTMLATFMLFAFFSAQFGIGALVGALLAGLTSAFGTVYYFNRFKNELYAGRSLKKAHQEAIKKTTWPVIDATVVSAIIGVSIFGFVGGVVGKMGLMLVIGGAFSLVVNLVFTRVQGWLLANDNSVANTFAKTYGVDPTKIPNLVKEEKQTYFGALANKDFNKKGKLMTIIGASLLAVSIVGVSIMSGVRGNAYNYAGAYDDTTTAYIEYRIPDSEVAKNANQLKSEVDVETKILSSIKLDGNVFDERYYNAVSLETGGIYLDEDETNYLVFYYTVEFKSHYAEDKDYDIVVTNGAAGDVHYSNFQDAFLEASQNVVGADNLEVSVKNVVYQDGTPTLGTVWLGLGLADLFVTIYLVLRFKLGKGLMGGLAGISASLITMGIISLTNMAVSPVASIALIAASFVTYLVSLIVYNAEKDIAHEQREKDKTTMEFKERTLRLASRNSSAEVIAFASIAAISMVVYFGLAPIDWIFVFLMSAVGIAIGTVFVLSVITGGSLAIDGGWKKLRSQFHLPKREKAASKRKKSNEPEEATFIGIND